jgi:hypothetical protein
MNLAGPSSALSGASGSNAGVLPKPPGTYTFFIYMVQGDLEQHCTYIK